MEEVIESFRKEIKDEAEEMNKKYGERHNLEIEAEVEVRYGWIEVYSFKIRDKDYYLREENELLIEEVGYPERLYKVTDGQNKLIRDDKSKGYIDFFNSSSCEVERKHLGFPPSLVEFLANAETVELDGIDVKKVIKYKKGKVTDGLREFAERIYKECGAR